MADDETSFMERIRERLGGLERMVERIDERMVGKLGKDDATTLMEFAANGGGGGFSVASVIALLLYMSGYRLPGMG